MQAGAIRYMAVLRVPRESAFAKDIAVDAAVTANMDLRSTNILNVRLVNALVKIPQRKTRVKLRQLARRERLSLCQNHQKW